jgi:asparagine synthase (glutamine-hydrolysing)
MPGIFGFTRDFLEDTKAHFALEDMQRLLHHSKNDAFDGLFQDDLVCASRVHLSIEQPTAQPYTSGALRLWLDGELFYQQALISRHQLQSGNDGEIFLRLYQKTQDLAFLSELDGVFAGVLVDTQAQKVFLFGDRFGLRHLYFAQIQGRLVWASETKAFLAAPGFTPKVDTQAFETFFFVGQLLENQSWLDGVQLLPSGSVLTWNIRQGSSQIQNYWNWTHIKPIEETNEDVIVEELLRLFKRAVEECCRSEKRVGLLLSGGQDSRAILAAMPELSYPTHAITFGTLFSDDVKLAKIVARKKGVVHHVLELTQDNWLEQRVGGVWWTDGQLDMMHMHATSVLNETSTPFDINLDGFCGDTVIGGFYEDESAPNLPVKQQNRARRFIALGSRLLGVRLHTRFPFMDNALVDFAVGLPVRYRYDFQIYQKMLLRGFGEYYRNIPWQFIGMPINWPKKYLPYMQQLRKLRDKISARNPNTWIQRTLGSTQFVDYARWIRRHPGSTWARSVLESNSALYPEYLPKAQVLEWLNDHLSGKNNFSTSLFRVLTFEVWLQQTLAGRFRPDLLT